MQAVILTNEGKFNPNHRKEKYFSKAYIGVVVVDGDILEVVDLRLYETPSRTYACIWLFGKMIYKNGSGYAGGYGYHLDSAAAGQAIENAGIQLSERIHGAGDRAIRQAVLAIVREIYPDAEVATVIEAHP